MSNVRRRAPAILKRRTLSRMPVPLSGNSGGNSGGNSSGNSGGNSGGGSSSSALISSKATYSVRTAAAASCTDNQEAKVPSNEEAYEVFPGSYCIIETPDGQVSVDVSKLDVESEPAEGPGRKSVSTQADFPSRALTALNHQLVDACHKVCPTLGTRALRDNVIEKLIEIVNDADESPKARFLLEQLFAYKTKMPHHSSFMTRHCKLLMDLSQKTYQHLKDVDGTGLLTLPTKGTLRNRYPETLPVRAKNDVEVLLQMEASAECPDGTTDDDDHAATYYYVVPSDEILPSDMMSQ